MEDLVFGAIGDFRNLSAPTLLINLRRDSIRDEIARNFGAFERVVIDVDDERHEYDADMVISALENYGRVAELKSENAELLDEINAHVQTVCDSVKRIAALENMVREAIRMMRECPEREYYPCMHDLEIEACELGLEA